ncbi:pyruvate, phosphate dikinase [Candidatus Enterococcus clewellii]|uniref:Pyruvate, phosphate dikinase n=1 Tax=Candidatus Enterococcus clewellii TaxID=1834193 RepID=A0A242KC93_9ENTE|nr:pyruvate, phosphate dikinase [Enterococcus sp. 9E7_DIV0242]OTP18772.1 pyruvate, phosphate dikinase [Enterococcus sp. 9E7_DIV0242]
MTFVYDFSEGTKEQTALLGGKGANLAEMTSLGLPVPNGFTITTEACIDYLAKEEELDTVLKKEIQLHISNLEQKTEKGFGNKNNPLLVSVRSGSKFSMPGMMDTILNLGLNDETVEALASKTSNGRFAYDCYRRLLQMFGDVVCGIDKNRFEDQLTFYKKKKGYLEDTDMTMEDWQYLVDVYKGVYQEVLHRPFPQDPIAQLFQAVEAVFRSWNNKRARTYRRLHQISDDLGTAVNIQEMVFGNSGFESGTGVAFTRNPATGERGIFGEFLLNAQGEDVVAGIRTPQPIEGLKQTMPDLYKEFEGIGKRLEAHYKDMQDIEFTIEDQKLYILQTRNGKRTAKASFNIAINLVEEGVLTKAEALQRITPLMITQLLHPVFDPKELDAAQVIAKGLPASPGAASGNVYFTAESAKAATLRGEKVILVRQETSPEDIEGMVVSEGIVTSRGGMTSHAAVVARGMGVCCVAGCEALQVDEFLEQIICGEHVFKAGDTLSVDGTTGTIYSGVIAMKQGNEQELLQKILGWAKEINQLKVYANAETPEDIKTALVLGADGIGLARTEHMFFGEDRISEMRKMILARDQRGLKAPLEKLKQYQKQDFRKIFQLMEGRPCTVRLLDPPLHEFLPRTGKEIEELAAASDRTPAQIRKRMNELEEQNPMLGHRGCRLAVSIPEIYEMQVRAIIETAVVVNQENKFETVPEIMIPLISTEEEMALLRNHLDKVIQEVLDGTQLEYKIGTMIETPRACLLADRIAQHADFFSFGTNDLTQLTFGFSRDDSGKFLGEYVDKKLLKDDPFQHLDEEGVGQLIKLAVTNIQKTAKQAKIGICGEVGGDPQSIRFLQQLPIDYVSCSPYRIPAALLTIAQGTKQ